MNNPKPPFAVLFDMDGVLMDTVPASMHARRVNAKLFGFTPDEMVQRSKPGRSLHDFYDTLQNMRPFKANFDEFSDRMLEEVFAYLEKHQNDTDPNLITFIEDLKTRHIPLAVGTSALKRSALRKLEIAKLRAYFDEIVTADDVKRHKPHPDIYHEAARRLGVPPEQCIVIEDAVDGITAGKTAGMKVVAYTKYVSDASALTDADITVNDYTALNYDKLLQIIKG